MVGLFGRAKRGDYAVGEVQPRLPRGCLHEHDAGASGLRRRRNIVLPSARGGQCRLGTRSDVNTDFNARSDVDTDFNARSDIGADLDPGPDLDPRPDIDTDARTGNARRWINGGDRAVR